MHYEQNVCPHCVNTLGNLLSIYNKYGLIQILQSIILIRQTINNKMTVLIGSFMLYYYYNF